MDANARPVARYLSPGPRDWAPFLIFLTGMVLLLPQIWSETSITGQDEYWLAFRTPMESLARESWITTWVNDEPRLRKPPLLYWAIMVSYELLGINLFAARIWGVLSGAGLAACAALLYRVLFRKSGWLAGLLTLATICVAIEGRRAMLDLPLALFTGLAVYGACQWVRSGRQAWALFSAGCLGLSFLVKGPLGLLLFAVASIVGLIFFKRWSLLANRWRHLFWSFVLLLALCLPWPLAMFWLWPEFSQVLAGEVGERSPGVFQLRATFSTLGKALGLVFPWSLVLLGAILTTLIRFGTMDSQKARWIAAWFLACAIPFLFMRTFTRYMTPLVPAACVLMAWWLEQGPPRLRMVLFRISVCLLGLAGLGFSFFFFWFHLAPASAIVLFAFTGFVLWSALRTQNLRLTVVLVALYFTLLMGGLYPSLNINALPQEILAMVGNKPVVSFDGSQPSMLSIRLQQSAKQVRSFVQSDWDRLIDLDGYVFMEEKNAPHFEELAQRLELPHDKAGTFHSFYSRSTWIRFAREDATALDWKTAFQQRSLDALRPCIAIYRVFPAPSVKGPPPP